MGVGSCAGDKNSMLERKDQLRNAHTVIGFAFGDRMTFLAVPVLIHDRTDRAIDRKLLPIDAESRNLSIKVREASSL